MPQSRLVMRVSLYITASKLVQLTDCRMPPSIWLRMPSGFTASPESTAATTRSTRRSPVSRSTFTSIASAQ